MVPLPQPMPSVSRVQVRDSVLVTAWQALPEHEYVVTVRDCVPDSPQVPAKPVQTLQAPTVGVPQLVPEVERPQAWVSVLVEGWQAPLAQAYVVTERD